MMRKFLGPIIFPLGLAACASAQIAANMTLLTQDVAAITVPLCSFLPVEQSIATIFNAGSPALQTANAIASAICASVSPATAPRAALLMAGKPSGQLPVVVANGHKIVVQGSFIK